MRRINPFILIILTFFPVYVRCASWFEEREPMLLTNSYNILNIIDIEKRQEIPPSFLGEWQCFKSQDITLHYSRMWYAEDWKSFVGDISIRVWNAGYINHEYWMPNPYPQELWNEWYKEWSALMDSETYTCIGGHFVDEERRFNFLAVEPTQHWIFERIKTKKGCSDRIFNCT